MATTLRNDAKKQLIALLQKQGYPTYARLVNLFDIYLTDDPEVIGYMIPNAARIVLNKDLNISQVSTIVRHEILHEYFTHAARKVELEKNHPELGSNHQLANIAMDYEISNRGYTEDDKITVRSIVLNNKVLQGLVTEVDYPDWQNKTFEEMYVELLKQRAKDKNSLKDQMKQLNDVSKHAADDLDDLKDSAASSPTDEPSDSPSPSKTSGDISDDESKDATNTDSSSDDASQEHSLSDEIDELQKELKDIDSTDPENPVDGPFNTPAEQQRKVDIAARVAELKREFTNSDTYKDIMKDVNIKKRSDIVKRAQLNKQLDYAKNGNGGLSNFKLDLKRFISKQVAERDKEDSYEIFNPSYEGSSFIMPGKWQDDIPNVPVINVYWDISGSFSDPRKTAGARAAIDSIQDYVKKGLISIQVYYHSNDVYTEPRSGGNDGNKVMDHILMTKPDNVIIITDGDLSNVSTSATVPGAVWMLFYDSTSSGLIKNLKGKKQTKWYKVEY